MVINMAKSTLPIPSSEQTLEYSKRQLINRVVLAGNELATIFHLNQVHTSRSVHSMISSKISTL